MATPAGDGVDRTRSAHGLRLTVAGSGPPVVLLHGIPAGRRLWDPLIERLASHFTCVAPDLPGMGQSPPLADGSRDPARFAAVIDALRSALGHDTWHVVGHDAGATVAVHYAAAHPERTRRLVLMAPPLFPEFRPPWFFRLLRPRGLGDLLAPLVVLAIWHGGIQSIIEPRGERTAEILASFREPFTGLAGARRLAWLVRWGNPREVLARTAAHLPSITTPTLLVAGTRDGAIPPEFTRRAARVMPAARAVFLDTGHFLPLNRPGELGEMLVAFLRNGATETT